MTLLTLIRHGETDWNRDRRIQGTTDIPLNDAGRLQARDVALRLLPLLTDPQRAVLVSSDLSRARETAEIIAGLWGAPAPRVSTGLRERAYGEAEGLTLDEFAARWGDGLTREIPAAESREELLARALRALREELDRAATDHDADHVFVVSHGALLRTVLHHVSGGTLPAPGERISNGADVTLEVDEHWRVRDLSGRTIGV